MKLVDFEFAYRLGDAIKDDRCGTDGYSAPEWCKATARLGDPRADQKLKVVAKIRTLFCGCEYWLTCASPHRQR